MAATARATWRITGSQPLLWQHWGSQSVVYHVDSGATHLLNPFAADVLQTLQQGPRTFSEIVVAVVSEGMDDTDGSQAGIEDLLLDFQERGLIESVAA